MSDYESFATKSAEVTKPIPATVEELVNVKTRLEKSVAILTEHLSPVLSAPSPNVSTSEQPIKRPGGSAIATSLGTLEEELSALDRKLGDLIRRLEI